MAFEARTGDSQPDLLARSDASNPVVERELVKRHFPRCKVPAISTGGDASRRCLGGKLKLRSTLSWLETWMRCSARSALSSLTEAERGE